MYSIACSHSKASSNSHVRDSKQRNISETIEFFGMDKEQNLFFFYPTNDIHEKMAQPGPTRLWLFTLSYFSNTWEDTKWTNKYETPEKKCIGSRQVFISVA